MMSAKRCATRWAKSSGRARRTAIEPPARKERRAPATAEDPAVDPRLSASRIDFPFVVERLSGQQLTSWARYGMTLLLLAIAGWQLRRFGDRDRLLAAGFATKSNFNRAFQLATGQNPSQWRALKAGQALQEGRGGATLSP